MYLNRLFSGILYRVIRYIPYFDFISKNNEATSVIYFNYWFRQKVLGKYSSLYWPIHKTSTFSGDWRNVYCGIDTSPGYSPGNYIQAIGKIIVGNYTLIAPNVGIISANHDVYDSKKHVQGIVKIGDYSWLGMGCLIMPNVTLGDFTIVAAGAVVTKSFDDGYCIIAGNPARIIKTLEKEKCIRFEHQNAYNGYIKNSEFEIFRKNNLKV